jgi:predicted permease
VQLDGQPAQPGAQGPSADFQVITSDYFRAMGMTLVRGRAFTDADGPTAPPVVIISQTFADRYFPGIDPIGRTVSFGGDLHHEIVGIVADARYRALEQPADPTFYIPFDQNDERWPFLSFLVWADAPPSAVIGAIRAAVRDADPNQPIARIRTFDELLASGLAPRRFNTLLVGLFALTALLLAAVGTFGVMAFSVASRTRELGVRSALGATPAELRQLVLGQGAWVGSLAVAIGLGAAWLTTRGMAAMLYEVKPADPATYVTVAIVLCLVALFATWLPARTATRVDPIQALREP